MATVAPDLDLDLRTRLFIDGGFVDAVGGGRFTTENPATGQPLAEVAEGDGADVDRAVAAARQAVEHALQVLVGHLLRDEDGGAVYLLAPQRSRVAELRG